MLRFFVKSVAKDTLRNAAGQLVGTGILMGMSSVVQMTNASKNSFWNSSAFFMNSSIVPNPNTSSPGQNPSEPSHDMNPSLLGWKS